MIEILNRQIKYWIDRKHFKNLLQRLINHYQLGDPEVTLAFVDNRVIRGLHRRFLNKDRATDVLSFPLNETAADGKFYLGDVIISVPMAFDQCFRSSHGLERELDYLTIHGFLHLKGFEHFKGLEEEEIAVRNQFFGEKHDH